MVKIQTFGVKSRLRNNEYLAFCREVESEIRAKDAATLKVTDAFTAFVNELNNFDARIVKVSGSVLTAEMEKADRLRDNLHVGIFTAIDGAKLHFDPLVVEAAKRLDTLSTPFRKAYKKSYSEQTGLDANLVQELESDKYKADVTALKLADWVAELKKANATCASISAARSREDAARMPKGGSGESRQMLDKAYDSLVELLNALALTGSATLYNDLFAWWNAHIDRYRVGISSRLGAGKGGQTGGGQTDPPANGGESDSPDEV